jgi:hypothetical protein
MVINKLDPTMVPRHTLMTTKRPKVIRVIGEGGSHYSHFSSFTISVCVTSCL